MPKKDARGERRKAEREKLRSVEVPGKRMQIPEHIRALQHIVIHSNGAPHSVTMYGPKER